MSGDHENFTRLVFYYTPEFEWNVMRQGDSVIVAFDMPALDADLSKVFEKISNLRLRSITSTSEPAELKLMLGCDCVLDTFQVRPGILALDIRDAHATPPAETASESLLPIVMAKSDPAERVFPVLEEILNLSETTPDLGAEDDLDNQRNIFAGRVRQGALSGLLEFATGRNETDDEGTDPSLEVEIESGHGKTSEDRLNIGCQSAGLFTFPEIAPDRHGFMRLGALRASLTDATGRIDENVAEELARLYISFSMGQEARAISQLVTGPQGEALGAIGGFIEGDHHALVIDGVIDSCPTESYAWTALNAAARGQITHLDRKKLLHSVEQLPYALQVYLAPELANLAVDLGNTETAQLLLNTVSRKGVQQNSRADLARARLALISGETEEGSRQLVDLARSNLPVAGSALHYAIEEAEVTAKESAELAQLARIARFQNRAESQDMPFLRTEIRADLARADLEGAANLLIELSRESPEAAAALAPEYAIALAAMPEREPFIRLATRSEVSDLIATPAKAVLDIAARLIEEGLHELGLAYLDKVSVSAGSALERQEILKATAFVGLSEFDTALVLLEGKTGETAKALSARALLGLGRYQDAAVAFEAIGDTRQAETALLLSGQWGRLQSGQTTVADLAGAVVSESSRPDKPPDDEMDIEGLRQLLSESQSSRAKIEAAFDGRSTVDPEAQ